MVVACYILESTWLDIVITLRAFATSERHPVQGMRCQRPQVSPENDRIKSSNAPDDVLGFVPFVLHRIWCLFVEKFRVGHMSRMKLHSQGKSGVN